VANFGQGDRRVPQDFKSRDLTEAPPQRREDFFRAALEQSPMSAQILSPDGKTLWVNHAWEELWGVTLAQLGDYNMLEDQQLVAKGVMPYIQKAFKGERTEIPAILYDPEETIPDLTAHQEEPGRWVRAFTFPVKDEDGKIREIVLMHEDITARKRAEEAAERWANIFEHVQWGVVIGSGDGNRLEMMNPAYAHMHGYTVAELINRPIADVYAPQARDVLAEQVRITHERGHHSFESLHMRKDGSIFPVLVQSTAMKDANGKLLYFAAHVQNVSERKRIEEELRGSEEKYRSLYRSAQEANRLKDEFLATVSHELRTPLTSILGWATMLRSNDFDEEAVHRALETIERNAKNQKQIIEDLLDVSRIITG
jgi:PAS domain S-box-containing protein